MMKLYEIGMNPYMGALGDRIAALRGQPVDPNQQRIGGPVVPHPYQLPSPPTDPNQIGLGWGQAAGLGRGLGLGYGYGNPYSGLFPRFRLLLGGGAPAVPSPVQPPRQTAYGWGGNTL
jgi:hypothetical protein